MKYSVTADYNLIESSLKSLWHQFSELEKEVNSFVPMTLEELQKEIGPKLTDSFREMMPNQTEDDIQRVVEKQILSNMEPGDQYSNKFSERFSTLQVMVTIISHALCESVINAILATECYATGKVEQFYKVERGSMPKKWTTTLSKFCPNYDLQTESEIFKTLDFLHEQRNSLAHYKVSLEAEDEAVIEGSGFRAMSYGEGIFWLKRFFSLPYDLAENAHGRVQENMVPALLAYVRNPIPRAHG